MRRGEDERELGEFARLKLERPRSIQRRAPQRIEPMCGISTTTRKKIVAQYATNDQRASV